MRSSKAMYRRQGALAALVLTVGLFMASDGRASTAFDGSWSMCGQATAAVERAMRIPRELLTAISLAESGRWDSENRETHAWPWTVTSGSDTWKLDTKADAIAMVRELKADGRSNIDVGCMQINLFYHDDAFRSLDEAFDPLSNARYAGSFLRRLYDNTRNWMTAAGNYHSNTAEYHNRYKLKVARFWNARRGIGAAPEAPGAVSATPGTRIAAIDHQRMAQLNQAFRQRQIERQAKETASAATGAIGASGGGLFASDYALQAQLQRVRKRAEQKRQVADLIRSETVPAANAEPDINPDLQLWRNLYRSGPTNGPFLSAGSVLP